MTDSLKMGFSLELPVKLQRRLQSLAIVCVIGGFFVFGPTCLAITLYWLSTRFWWISVGYLMWYTVDQYKVENIGDKRHFFFGKWIRNWPLWEYTRDYFPISIVKTCDLDANENYILGYHPHGIITFGAFSAFATNALNFKDKFEGISTFFFMQKCWFFIPYLREVLLLLGMRSASSKNFTKIIGNEDRKGRCVVLAIGASEEAIYATPGNHTIVLSSRFGFIKKAIMHGAHLVPAYGFGEDNLFLRHLEPEASFWRWIQDGVRMTIASVFPKIKGRNIFNYAVSLMPKRDPIRIVVGRPVVVEANPTPNAEEVLELHRRYCNALTDLFEKHKAAHGLPKSAHLEIL